MSNHCTDVVCASCGNTYCLRCLEPQHLAIDGHQRYLLQQDTTMRYTLKCHVCRATTLYPLANLEVLQFKTTKELLYGNEQ